MNCPRCHPLKTHLPQHCQLMFVASTHRCPMPAEILRSAVLMCERPRLIPPTLTTPTTYFTHQPSHTLADVSYLSHGPHVAISKLLANSECTGADPDFVSASLYPMSILGRSKTQQPCNGSGFSFVDGLHFTMIKSTMNWSHAPLVNKCSPGDCTSSHASTPMSRRMLEEEGGNWDSSGVVTEWSQSM